MLALANEVIASRAFLAAHEQEPDYYVVLDSDIPYDVFKDEDRANIYAADVNGLFSLQKFYTHPAPVPAVPELVPEWMKDKLITIYDVVEDNDEYCQYIWHACRAAMLNYSGDAKNSTN